MFLFVICSMFSLSMYAQNTSNINDEVVLQSTDWTVKAIVVFNDDATCDVVYYTKLPKKPMFFGVTGFGYSTSASGSSDFSRSGVTGFAYGNGTSTSTVIGASIGSNNPKAEKHELKIDDCNKDNISDRVRDIFINL